MIRIAIDGPGGAGKSTIAKLLAKRLNIDYVDTGAMYRGIALKILESGIDIDDQVEIKKMLDDITIDFNNDRLLLDGKDISKKIRTQEVSMLASSCSAIGVVREKLVAIQKEIAKSKSLVMDGRDIGTNVIKDAEVKIFLTADPMVRAKRRYDELISNGKKADLEEIYEETKERDLKDSTREINPLKQADDAIYIDSTDMDIDEVVNSILEIVNNLKF